MALTKLFKYIRKSWYFFFFLVIKMKGLHINFLLRNASSHTFISLYKQTQSVRNWNKSIKFPSPSLVTSHSFESSTSKISIPFQALNNPIQNNHYIVSIEILTSQWRFIERPSFMSKNLTPWPLSAIRNEISAPSLSWHDPWASTLVSPKT